MGIPYSKQIHSAFDQSQIMMRRLQTEVTPLVAAGYPLVASGFEVLKTTKNIAILLAVVQVYTALMLTVIFGVGCMLLVTTNPDLEDERAGEMESEMVVEGENETGSEDKEEDGSDEKNEVDDMDDVGK